MSFFQRLYEYQPELVFAAASATTILVLWLGFEWLARQREERRAEDEADAEWEAKQAAARNKLPTALSIPDAVHVKQEPVAPVADAIIQSIRRRAARPRPAAPPKRAKRPNKSRARHK